MTSLLLSIVNTQDLSFPEQLAKIWTRVLSVFSQIGADLGSLPEAAGKLSYFLGKPYVQHALIVGVLIALCSSVLGVSLVLKRLSFIGDGLSHVAFGAMAVAAIVGLTDEMLLILPVTVLTAVLLLRTGRNRKIMGDASLAMLSVGALGLGYLLMNKFSASANVSGDVCSTLFGSTSIMTLSDFDVWLCVGMSAAVLLIFCFSYKKIFAVTFDADFAAAAGARAGVYNTITAVITGVIIVLAMNLVGSLLISALVVFPALSAMRLFRSFRSVVVCSAAVSVGSALTGILLSILISTPVGSTIVVTQILVFLVFFVIGKVMKR